jgi:hypothetical protein
MRTSTRGVAALLALTIVASSIQWVPSAQADNGPVDIGSHAVRVVFRAPPQDNPSADPSTWTQVNVASAAGLLCAKLPQQACQQVQQIAGSPLMSQPIGQKFDAMWSKTTNQQGRTMRDQSCDRAKQQAAQAVHANTGQTAYNLSCDFPSSGSVRAWIGTQQADSGQFVPALGISYYLSHNVVRFTVTKPDTCFENVESAIGNFLTGGAGCVVSLAPDPQFSVSFDAEVLLYLLLPSEPCAMTSRGAVVMTHNASISADNFTGDIAQAVESIIDHDAFPSAEQALDSEVQPISFGLASDLGPLEQGCSFATWQGFSQFDAVVDPNTGLTFRLTHPLGATKKPSLLGNTTPSPDGPSLIHPTIWAQPSQVPAGGQLEVSGNYFPGSNASQLHVILDDPGSVALSLRETDLDWGPANGPITHVTKPRTPSDGQAYFDATNLTPNTHYRFRSRDCDNVTCSQWSDWADIATAVGDSNQVTIYLDSATPGQQVGTAMPVFGGTFTTTVTLPASTTVGTHSLLAIGGSQQSAPPQQITVVGASQRLKPEIRITYANRNPGPASLLESEHFTLTGYYFASGQVTIYLDNTTGPALGTATAGNDGTFHAQLTMPFGSHGDRTLVATETANGQTLQATASVFVQPQPR